MKKEDIIKEYLGFREACAKINQEENAQISDSEKIKLYEIWVLSETLSNLSVYVK